MGRFSDASRLLSRGMSKHFWPWKIDQTQLLPPSIGDFVPEDHLARFVVALVRESLDLRAVTAQYASALGQPPFDPRLMVALLLYAYAVGIYSSRRIAKACRERADFMMIVALDAPDFRTISDFRKRHLQALAGLFVQVLRLAETAGLVKLGHVALDGTKIKANASKHKAMSYARMKQREAELQAEVERWLAAAEAADAEEDRAFGTDKRSDELPDWVADKEKWRAKIREAKAALEAEAEAAAEEERRIEAEKEKQRQADGRKRCGRKPAPPSQEPPAKAQRNFTDPESRIQGRLHPRLQRPGRGGRQGANHRRARPDAQHERSGSAGGARRWHREEPRSQACGGLGRCRLLQRGQPRGARCAASKPMWQPDGPSTRPMPSAGSAAS